MDGISTCPASTELSVPLCSTILLSARFKIMVYLWNMKRFTDLHSVSQNVELTLFSRKTDPWIKHIIKWQLWSKEDTFAVQNTPYHYFSLTEKTLLSLSHTCFIYSDNKSSVIVLNSRNLLNILWKAVNCSSTLMCSSKWTEFLFSAQVW